MDDIVNVDVEFALTENAQPAALSNAARKRRKSKKKKKGGKPGNQGDFHGPRAELVDAFLSTFTALKGATRAVQNDFWHRLFAKYWAAFPWYYALHEDPSTTNREPPEETPEVLEEKGRVIEDTQKKIRAHLRYLRQVHLRRHENPFSRFFDDLDEEMHPPPPPRQLAPWQLYMSKKREEIETEFHLLWPSSGLPEKERLAFRSKIARDMLLKETPEYIAALAAEVTELHLADLEYEKEEAERAGAPIPLDAQMKARESVVDILQSLLEAVRKRTGFYLAVLAGIPLVEGGREFQVKVVTAGKTGGDAPLPWHLVEKERFRTEVMGSFIRFLTMTKEYEDRQARLSGNEPGNAAIPTGATAGGTTSAAPPETSTQAQVTSTSRARMKQKRTEASGSQKAKGKAAAKPKGHKKASAASDEDLSSSDSGSDSDSESSSSSDSTPEPEPPEMPLEPPQHPDDTYEDPPEGAVIPTAESLKLWDGAVKYLSTLSEPEQRKRLHAWSSWSAFSLQHMLPSEVVKEAALREKLARAQTGATPSTPAGASATTATSASPVSLTSPSIPPPASSPSSSPGAQPGSSNVVSGGPMQGSEVPVEVQVSTAQDGATHMTSTAASPSTTAIAPPAALAPPNHSGTPSSTAPVLSLSTATAVSTPAPPTTSSSSLNGSVANSGGPTPSSGPRDLSDDMIIVDDSSWPQWVRQCFDFMESKQLGSVFMRALEWWTVLERSYNWENGKGLSTTHRPEEVTEWLKVLRRNTAKSPRIKDELIYAETWWRWWGGLQPSWRPRNADGHPVVGGEGDWSDLKKPGKNGLLIVLLTLTWWDDAASDATRSQWHAAVEDVSWVIVSMAKEARSGAGPVRKRASTTGEDSRPRPRPKRARRS